MHLALLIFILTNLKEGKFPPIKEWPQSRRKSFLSSLLSAVKQDKNLISSLLPSIEILLDSLKDISIEDKNYPRFIVTKMTILGLLFFILCYVSFSLVCLKMIEKFPFK